MRMNRVKWFRVARRDAWIRQGRRCVYCYTQLKEHEITGDHVIPKTKGGTDRGNIVAACQTCNILKGSMTAKRFKHKLKSKNTKDMRFRIQGAIRRINLEVDRSCKRILAFAN